MKTVLLSSFLSLMFLVSPALASERTAGPLPRLQVQGNHLTAAGAPITLHGVSLCSVEWTNAPKDIDDLTRAGTAWPLTVIRLPVQLKEWDRIGGENHIHGYLDRDVAACDRNNVYCMIDWHDIADWNRPETEQKFQEFWRLVAPRYANDPHILYELFNEPVAPGEMTKDNWLAYKATADRWIATIRRAAPHTVLLVGSPHWSQMPAFASEAPLADKNILYVMHLYPNWPRGMWDGLFGNASATVPIFISEWGWSSQPAQAKFEFAGTQSGFGEPLRQYLDARPQIGWTAWSYDPACGPAMLGVDRDMGSFVQHWLQSIKAK